MFEKNPEEYFTRRLSFTEKSKQRLEIHRRRSLQSTNDESRSFDLTFIIKVFDEA